MKKKSIAELGHNDLLPVIRALFCLNANISYNVEQNLVTFNQNDLQFELFQIFVTFTQIDYPKWPPLSLLKIAKIKTDNI